MINMIRYFLVFLLLVGINNVWSQDNLSKKEKKKMEKQEMLNEMIKLVKNKKIEFIADRAFPSGWRSIDLTTNPNYLRLSNDSASADMPFYGRAYQHIPGDRGGIQFDNEINDRELTINEKKGRMIVSFNVKGKNDVFRCQLEVFYSGSASLIVISNNLQSISYGGEITEWIPNKE